MLFYRAIPYYIAILYYLFIFSNMYYVESRRLHEAATLTVISKFFDIKQKSHPFPDGEIIAGYTAFE